MQNNVSVPKIHLATGSESLISTSGASLLLQTASISGLATGLSQALAPWRKPLAVHDPAKMILDLAVAVAVGGDCLADVSLLRAQPEVFGPVASDPTISRLLDTLAGDVDGALAAIRAARATARAKVWDHQSPLADDTQVIIDLDATLIGSHSEKELASQNYKRGFGFHPMMAFTDHGHGGTGEPAAALLRTGRAGANDAQDQITVLDAALALRCVHRKCRLARPRGHGVQPHPGRRDHHRSHPGQSDHRDDPAETDHDPGQDRHLSPTTETTSTQGLALGNGMDRPLHPHLRTTACSHSLTTQPQQAQPETPVDTTAPRRNSQPRQKPPPRIRIKPEPSHPAHRRIEA